MNSDKGNVWLTWIQLASLALIQNVKRLFWPLWARHFIALAHARDWTVAIFWRAAKSTACSTTDHTSVSTALISKQVRAQISILFFLVPGFQRRPGKVIPNCLRLMNQRQITQDPMENMQAGGTSALKWTESVACSANLFNPQLCAMEEWNRRSLTPRVIDLQGFLWNLKIIFLYLSDSSVPFFPDKQTELPEFLSVTLVQKTAAVKNERSEVNCSQSSVQET